MEIKVALMMAIVPQVLVYVVDLREYSLHIPDLFKRSALLENLTFHTKNRLSACGGTVSQVSNLSMRQTQQILSLQNLSFRTSPIFKTQNFLQVTVTLPHVLIRLMSYLMEFANSDLSLIFYK